MIKSKEFQGVKGIRIRTLNCVMIVAACVLYAFLLYLTVQVFSRYEAMTVATDDYIHCEKAAAMVLKGSDELTEMSRSYVATGEADYAEGYFEEANVNRGRERGLRELEQYHSNDQIHLYLETALGCSYDLMEREIYAMALSADARGIDRSLLPQEIREAELKTEDLALDAGARLARAQEMVLGSAYRDAKALIDGNIDFCLNSTLSAMEGQHLASTEQMLIAIRHQRLCITILVFMNVLIFILISLLIIRPLRIYIKNIGDNKALEVIGSYEFKYLALTYNSVYDLNAANETMLRHQAERDPLTGAMNRGFFDRLQRGLRESPVPVTLALLDVDKFKQINDTFGHGTGDQVLQKVATILTDNFRESDFVIRLGGDEFCVVLTEASKELMGVVGRKFDRINATLSAQSDGLPPISLSVGVACSNEGFDDELYHRADKALYLSKENGRGRCSFDRGTS